MDMSLILTSAMFLTLIAFLMSGFPVAFTLGGTGLLFGLIGAALGVFDLSFMGFLSSRIFDNIIRNELLFAVPLFVMMGVMLEKSNVAEDLLESMGKLFGRLRGGLGLSVTIVGALLAASTGIVGATVVTMGLLSLPSMLRAGYSPSLATGSIAASGTLGQIIPPSIVLILLADVMSSAWQQAQLDSGNFSPSPMSAGELFAGALIPGLLLVGMYMAFQILMAIVKPDSSPAMVREDMGDDSHLIKPLLNALFPPLVLIIAVLGSILTGIATPTEAASVGAIGAILLGAAKSSSKARPFAIAAVLMLSALLIVSDVIDLRLTVSTAGLVNKIAFGGAALMTLAFMLCLAWCLWTVKSTGVLAEVTQSTLRISTMIYTILIGAALFSLVFRGLGGDEIIEEFLFGMEGGHVTALIVVMLLMFFLGFFLDFIEITFVVVPVVAPILLAMDGIHGPIWLGVLMAMNLQTSFLTPPFGFALFYLRSVTPEEVPTTAMYRGVIPFVIIQIVALLLIAFNPGLVTWLPSLLFQH